MDMRRDLKASGAIATATIAIVWASSVWAEEAPAAGGTTEAAPAANAPPPDPTRGQWDSFLDPLRDFEDDYITGTQKTIEDATGMHVAVGIQEAWEGSFHRATDSVELTAADLGVTSA